MNSGVFYVLNCKQVGTFLQLTQLSVFLLAYDFLYYILLEFLFTFTLSI